MSIDLSNEDGSPDRKKMSVKFLKEQTGHIPMKMNCLDLGSNMNRLFRILIKWIGGIN